MSIYQQQLFGARTFLGYTLDPDAEGVKNNLLLSDNVLVELWDRGVLYFHPKNEVAANSILLSVGVHGNETAPIEIIDQLVSDIFSGKISVKHNLLIVIANPDAINSQSREVAENMNRLFNNDAKIKDGDGAERRRCIRLMDYSKRFFSRHATYKFHYDLHTAIRDSFYEKFAISPNVSLVSLVEAQYSVLGQWGIEAILTTDKKSATYSAFTAQHCSAISFTLELGKVKPFGENDLEKMSSLTMGLYKMISANMNPPTETQIPKRFRVATEIIKQSKEFQLCFPSSTANFTEFAIGDLLAVDKDCQYRVVCDGERILFPNESVAIGQRALVIIRPENNPKASNHE